MTQAGVAFDPDTYTAAVAALFARRPEIMLPGLERIEVLAARLGDPQRRYPSVHLTGTNGKTSMARMATALLLAAGRRVGTYTSPHLQDVRERIRLDGVPLTPEALYAVLDAVVPVADAVGAERGEMVTFFETLTAMAYTAFADARVDVGVFEVGMGGRWDATNLVDGRVAVIGTVGLDHPELGSTVAEVATEKAGIIKAGAHVVVGPQAPEALAVITAEAQRQNATVLSYGRDFAVEDRRIGPRSQRVTLRTPDARVVVELPLAGQHQAVNAACALTAVEALSGPIGDEAVARGLADVRSPGRLEVFDRPGRARVVLDGAHNGPGAEALAAALRVHHPGRRVVVIGVLADKDMAAIVAPLVPLADAVVVTRPDAVRAGDPADLAAAVTAAGQRPMVVPDVAAALSAADDLAGDDDVVVVTGSLYTVGQARGLLGAEIG